MTTNEQNTKRKIPNTNKGITLIALVITIIVMLILVAVTVTMAVNGGLFGYAQNAGIKTNEAVRKEQELGNGRIKIGDFWYDSPQDYVVNKLSENQGHEKDKTDVICSRCLGTGVCNQWTCPEGCVNINEPNEGWEGVWYCNSCDMENGIQYILPGMNDTPPPCSYHGTSMSIRRRPELVLVCPTCESILEGEPVWSNGACTLCQEGI